LGNFCDLPVPHTSIQQFFASFPPLPPTGCPPLSRPSPPPPPSAVCWVFPPTWEYKVLLLPSLPPGWTCSTEMNETPNCAPTLDPPPFKTFSMPLPPFSSRTSFNQRSPWGPTPLPGPFNNTTTQFFLAFLLVLPIPKLPSCFSPLNRAHQVTIFCPPHVDNPKPQKPPPFPSPIVCLPLVDDTYKKGKYRGPPHLTQKSPVFPTGLQVFNSPPVLSPSEPARLGCEVTFYLHPPPFFFLSSSFVFVVSAPPLFFCSLSPFCFVYGSPPFNFPEK